MRLVIYTYNYTRVLCCLGSQMVVVAAGSETNKTEQAASSSMPAPPSTPLSLHSGLTYSARGLVTLHVRWHEAGASGRQNISLKEKRMVHRKGNGVSELPSLGSPPSTIYLSSYLSVHVSVCLFVCLSMSLSMFLCVRVCVCLCLLSLAQRQDKKDGTESCKSC